MSKKISELPAATAFTGPELIEGVQGGASKRLSVSQFLDYLGAHLNANLTAFSGLTLAADRLPYATGAGALSLTVLTAAARNLLDDPDADTMLTTLGAVKVSAALTALRAVTPAANKLAFFDSATTAALADFPAQARTLLAATTPALQRAAIGVRELTGTEIEGLSMQWVSGTALTVGSGGAVIPGTNAYLQVPSAIALTGLSLTASTLYHVYLYSNSGAPAVEVVTAAPLATVGQARTKTGDTSRRYLGSVWVAATGGMAQFKHNSRTNKILFVDALLPSVTTGVATAATLVTTPGLPVTAESAELYVRNNATTVGNLYVYAAGSSSLNFVLPPNASIMRGWLEMPLNASQQFSYSYDATPTGGTPGANIFTYGYTFGR